MNENIFNINRFVAHRKSALASRRSAAVQRGLRSGAAVELIEGDVMVLIGTAAAVKAGEDLLLRGRPK